MAAIVFTQGCNFRCPYCHNAPLIPLHPWPDRSLVESDVLENLERLSGKITGVVVSGGEPTLQPDLADFLFNVRSLGLETKLDTNGSHPEILQALLVHGLLSYVAMDIKAPVDKYPAIAQVKVCVDRILESIDLIAQSNVEHEFRTTVDQTLLSAEDLDAIRQLVPSGSTFRLQAATRSQDRNEGQCYHPKTHTQEEGRIITAHTIEYRAEEQRP